MEAQPVLDNQVIVALIAAIAGIITTWLTVKYRNRIVTKNAPHKPKDRMDTIFDGYEKLILQQQQEIDRKQVVIGNLEDIVDNLERELNASRETLASTKSLLAEAKHELRVAKDQNIKLTEQLAAMRKEYGRPASN